MIKPRFLVCLQSVEKDAWDLKVGEESGTAEEQQAQQFELILQECGHGRFQWSLFLTLGLALMADGVEMFVVGFVLPSAEQDMCLSRKNKGWLGKHVETFNATVPCSCSLTRPLCDNILVIRTLIIHGQAPPLILFTAKNAFPAISGNNIRGNLFNNYVGNSGKGSIRKGIN